jgi:dihydroorotase
MGTWITNGQVWDGQNVKAQAVLVENGKIAALVEHPTAEQLNGHDVVDAKGNLVSAGFIDMHVHFREPGFEHKETIETGSKSAVVGGFTTVACMPNTRPVLDKVETIELVLKKAKEAGYAKVLPYGCITLNQLGRELTDFDALHAAGAFAFTDDGVGVQNAAMMKTAMAKAASIGAPVVAHCEEDTLVAGAVTDGEFAKKHGLVGIPNESESIHVGRDALLAEATGVHYHVCHVSTEQSVRLIRLAKSVGVKITAEVCPHHLLLSDEDIPSLDANWKMNPPLRSPKDVQAVIAGIEDGTIDILVTDHAPHSEEEKAKGMEKAPFGIVGLETAFPLMYTKFVKTGKWTLEFLLSRMTDKPADVFQLNTGKLVVGAPADITIVDLNSTRKVDPATFATKGRNTPFTGWELQGWPIWTMVDGQVVWSN